MTDKFLKSLNIGDGNIYKPLPLVTSDDNGKILKVTDGEWGAGYAVPVDWSSITWADGTDENICLMVAAADQGIINLADYWNVGDTRRVQLSAMDAAGIAESQDAQPIDLVLMHVGGYDLDTPVASGRSKCSFIVGMKDCLSGRISINSTVTNSGSWDGSALRTWCNNAFKNAIPSTLLPIFKQFKTVTAETYNGTTLKTSIDWFSLPAAKEVLGGTASSAGDETGGSNLTEFNNLFQFDWYKKSEHGIKHSGIDSDFKRDWWTRSPYWLDMKDFIIVDTRGILLNYPANMNEGISPFGCI